MHDEPILNEKVKTAHKIKQTNTRPSLLCRFKALTFLNLKYGGCKN